MTTQYLLADGTLLGVMVPNQYRLIFLRDNNDTIYGFKYYKYVSSSATYNYNQTYYYEFNLQGDVVALYNAAGTLTATYKYDAWGKLLGVYSSSGTAITSSTNLAIMNPIRYRGYLYDTETGLYYLNSRYYDPEVGRFINLDAYVNANGDFIGFNMYAYCGNNPTSRTDATGEAWYHWAAAGAFIGSATCLGTAVIYAASEWNSVQEFCDYGSNELVLDTFLAGVSGGIQAYSYCGTPNPSRRGYKGQQLAEESVNTNGVISAEDARRIQNAANRTNQSITVVGSRAAGTAGPYSDWDYILSGNSAQRHSAASSLPAGVAGGANNSGIDIFSSYPFSPHRTVLDPTRPHITFNPQ